MKRNKFAVKLSGIDPELKQLSRTHAIRSSRKRTAEKAVEKYKESLEHVERYWNAVNEALVAQGLEGLDE